MTGFDLLVVQFNSTNILVILTFLYAVFLRVVKKGYSHYLLLLLTLSFANESLYIINVFFDIDSVMVFSNLYLMLHHLLWLLLLRKSLDKKRFANFIIVVFVAFAITETLILKEENYIAYSFVMGSLCYLVLIFLESFKKLKDENFDFIFSNNFRLLCAPILFFFGMSLMFSFVEKGIRSTAVTGTFTLYEIVSCFTNIIYYTLILLYLNFQSKLHYERR